MVSWFSNKEEARQVSEKKITQLLCIFFRHEMSNFNSLTTPFKISRESEQRTRQQSIKVKKSKTHQPYPSIHPFLLIYYNKPESQSNLVKVKFSFWGAFIPAHSSITYCNNMNL